MLGGGRARFRRLSRIGAALRDPSHLLVTIVVAVVGVVSVSRMVDLLLAGKDGVGRVPHDGMGGHVTGLWGGLVAAGVVFFLDGVEARANNTVSSCGVLVVSLCCWGDKVRVVVDGL